MFSTVFVELSPVKIVVVDRAELQLIASQVSPGTVFG